MQKRTKTIADSEKQYKMKISSVTLENPTILAPLAGITNLPFRLMAKDSGCGLVCSEMISSNGLVYKSEKTLRMLDSTPAEKPLSVQIFGSNPDIMADAAAMVESSGADILDINFGCSVKKVIKTGSGAALMRTPGTAEAILTAVRKAINIPFTIKLRTGWDRSGEQALNLAKMAEACGVDAIAVHPRTATQGFGGSAYWPLITEVKKSVSIPVIGNGDIVKPQDAMKMMAETQCDGVMVGRTAIGQPWIFSQICALIRDRDLEPISLDLRQKTMIRYLKETIKYCGEEHGCRMMRSRLGWFVKGLSRSSMFRESIKHLSSEAEALDIIGSYMASLRP
jgi:tRNA-dihydrouridine synthase B